MRIAILSTPHIACPPRGYGASELIAGLIVEDLAARGHEVTLFATADSTARATALRHFPPAAALEPFELRELLHVGAALTHADEFDVVHNHCLAAGPPALAVTRAPTLTTLHYVSPAVVAFPTIPYVAVSRSQRALHPTLGVVGVVHHGIDLGAHPFQPVKDDYLLFLGRFHPNKGAHLAIEVAHALGARLILAAPPPPPDQQAYFDAAIRPNLNGRTEWIGQVEGAAKAQLIGRARCLLAPICWEEPFGLVSVEALACGTPVVAFRRGAIPEIVDHGETGFVVDDVREMTAAIARVGEIDPRRCRRAAETRFDRHRMADEYLRLYQSVCSGNRPAVST